MLFVTFVLLEGPIWGAGLRPGDLKGAAPVTSTVHGKLGERQINESPVPTFWTWSSIHLDIYINVYICLHRLLAPVGPWSPFKSVGGREIDLHSKLGCKATEHEVLGGKDADSLAIEEGFVRSADLPARSSFETQLQKVTLNAPLVSPCLGDYRNSKKNMLLLSSAASTSFPRHPHHAFRPLKRCTPPKETHRISSAPHALAKRGFKEFKSCSVSELWFEDCSWQVCTYRRRRKAKREGLESSLFGMDQRGFGGARP